MQDTNAQSAAPQSPATEQQTAPASTAESTPSSDKTAKVKGFNLHTYKYHRLGDYPAAIKRFGTTDNTTTQTVSADSGYGISHSHAVALVLTHTARIQGELKHRRVKQFYAHTNKTVKFAWQIARHQRRQAYLHRLQLEQPQTTLPIRSQTKHNRKAPAHRSQLPRIPLQLPFEASEPLPPSSPKEHYQISEEQAHPVDLPEYLTTNRDDPSFKVRCPNSAALGLIPVEC